MTILQIASNPLGLYSDSRNHGYQGQRRNIRLYRAAPSGVGAISKSEDGLRCAVTGKESLRIIQISDGSQPVVAGQKSSVGRGGHRLDASRNFWDGSGLKMDCASTDVVWAHGAFNSKILTSARNGEVIMWDVNKSGTGKYERRSKDHLRSINAMSVSQIIHHYCITGSADGDMRVWDLRDMTRSLIRVHHPTSVRSLAFSPSSWQPLHAVVGLDNGSIYRWDLKMGQRGLLDRLQVAHTSSVTSLAWCNQNSGSSPLPGTLESPGNGLGWLVSGSLDRHVKAWDLTAPSVNARIPHRPTYTLYPSFPVRHVVWRPSYECEVAVVSNADFSAGSNSDLNLSSAGTEQMISGASAGADTVEIWDVRRSWIPKWSVTGSVVDGSVMDLTFADADAIWTQHASGTFCQVDLRDSTKPLDSVISTAAAWDIRGSVTFVADVEFPWQVPYDDVPPEKRTLAEQRQVQLKRIGDPSYKPFLQGLGTVENSEERSEEAFKQLARGYVLHGADRPSLCAANARVAYEAEQESIAKVWLLLSVSLKDSMALSHPKALSQRSSSGKGPEALSASVVNAEYTFPSSANTPSQLRKMSPSNQGISSIQPRSSSASASRKLTPVSSNASSPHQFPSTLPPLPSVTYRRPSFKDPSRDFADPDLSRRPSVSIYRRPSLSTPGSHSISPVAERSATGGSGGASLRHVGEGALDDSDSSSSCNGGDHNGGPEHEDGLAAVPSSLLASPQPFLNRSVPVPSPLSKVAGQNRWSEEETQEGSKDNIRGYNDDDVDGEEGSSTSPSPRSTDTESMGSGSSPPRLSRTTSLARSVSRKRSSFKIKSRSRSSTVASLAAGSLRAIHGLPLLPPMVHHDSQSSIRTVTAGEVTFLSPAESSIPLSIEAGGKAEENLHEMREHHQERRKSLAISETGLLRASSLDVKTGARGSGSADGEAGEPGDSPDDADPAILTNRRIELVRVDEKRFRDLAWSALRETLEEFADVGDTQTCAMLALIASEELKIPQRRVTRFLESYIDLLSRFRLYACAAYLRKYCELPVIQNLSLIETTIYASCGRCKKPIVVPAGTVPSSSQVAKGGYGICLSCRRSSAICAVCRLPVRTLFFQCSICKHGGHQTCYRNYYANGPQMEIGRRPRSPIAEVTSMLVLPDTDSSGTGAPTAKLRKHPSAGFEEEATGESSDSSSLTASMTLQGSSLRQSLTAGSGSRPRLAGYPCAAGCGHMCWASNVSLDGNGGDLARF